MPDNVFWFYWDKYFDNDVCCEAINKLKLKKCSIIDILNVRGVHNKINDFIEKEKFDVLNILNEIENEINIAESLQNISEHFKENLSKLKIWQFPDDVLL